MTLQEIYDKVKNGLIAQGAFAFENGEGCKYRTRRGFKCAAGMLIPERRYRRMLEGICVTDVSPFTLGVGREQMPLVIELQEAHDQNANPPNYIGWAAAMNSIAIDYELKP